MEEEAVARTGVALQQPDTEADLEAVGQAVEEGEGRLLPVGRRPEPLAELEAEGQKVAVVLSVSEPVTLPLLLSLLLTLTVGLPVGLRAELRLPLGQEEGERLVTGLLEALGQRLPLAVPVLLPQVEGEPDAVTEGGLVADTQGEALTLRVPLAVIETRALPLEEMEAEAHTVPLKVPLLLTVTVLERVRVALAEGQVETLVDALTLRDTTALRLAVTLRV